MKLWLLEFFFVVCLKLLLLIRIIGWCQPMMWLFRFCPLVCPRFSEVFVDEILIWTEHICVLYLWTKSWYGQAICRSAWLSRSWIHVVHDCLSTCPATWSATTVHVEQCSWSNSFLENCVFVLILSVFIEKFIYVCIAGVEASLMLALKAGCML